MRAKNADHSRASISKRQQTEQILLAFRRGLLHDFAMTSEPTDIAQAIIRQHQSGSVYKPLDEGMLPASIDDAYQAQFSLHKLHRRGGFDAARGVLGGRKIALASAVQQELCGVDHPIAGGIFASEIHDSPAELTLSDYHGLGLEFELACVLGDSIVPGETLLDAAAAKKRVASIHPAFEMIIDRGADYSTLDARTMIADNAWCAGIVLGPAISDWETLDVEALTGTLSWNEEDPISAQVGDADPFGSLAWVANVLTGAGQMIHQDEVVITGSIIKTRAPLAGDKIRYQIADATVDIAVG